MSGSCRDGDQGFDGMSHIRVGNAKIAVATLLGAGDQSGVFQLGQMFARGGGVEGVTPASRANSDAVRESSDISASSIFERAGSPIIAAAIEISGPSFIV